MAQVIKRQLGGDILYQPFTPSILNVLDVRYNTQVLVDYLKDVDKRKKYTNEYRGFNEQQTKAFNTSLDNYIRGIEDGKIIFSNNGLTKLTKIDGVDPTMEPYIKEYFNSSIQSGLIPMYDEDYKDAYKVDLNKVLSRHLLGEETDSSIFNPAWLALDPKDEETLLRGIKNRRSAYVKALRAEADRLENDSKYRSKFKFSGWENDLNAYKKVVLALRAHADEIEKVNDFEKDESWILKAAAIGLSARDVLKRFFRGEADESGNEILHEDGFDKLNIGFLGTEDPTYYSKNKKYTINDDYENLPEEVKAIALLLLLAYDRKQIKKDWYYWENYVDKYLENLTPHFSNLEVSVYSVSNGPVSNVGKKFFIRRRGDQYPSEVELIRNADGTYTAHNSNTNINLGQYTESDETRAARTYDAFGDLGLPISINLALVLKDTKSINDYFNYLIQDDTRHMNPKMFSNVLMYLSAWLWNRPDGREYTNFPTTGKGRNWYGSSFEIRGDYNKPTAFIWKFRNYGLKFEFTKPNNFIKFGNFIALNPKNIKSVTIDYAHKLKTGGKLKKFLAGGLAEYVEYLKKYGLNRPVDFDPIKNPNKTKEEQKEDDKYNLLVIEGEPTTADKVRFAAATTDLLSSFLVFPKGTNIAALTGTGLSFLGYLTADAIDIVNGKLPAADTLLNDAKLAAVMAMPLFINPTKAKALGAGERMQKLAGMAARYVGTAFALGLIATQELRDDILRSWGKITNPTKMDAHDLTNIAFTLRLVAGGKEHVKNYKNNRLYKKAKSDNLTGQIDYKVKIGDKETTSSIKVNKGDALDKESVIQRIIDENKALELKPEQVTILNKIKKTSIKERLVEEKEKLVNKIKSNKENQSENTSEGTTENKLNPAETSTKQSNEVVHVDWKDNRTDNPNIEYQEWIPNRAFQYAVKENGSINRYNTKFGEWLRGMLGPNWDLVYSDYRLVKGYRLGKINQLNKGLFTTLDLFRKLGKELEEIRQSALEGEAKNTALLARMSKFGYNISDQKAALAKANEMADLYVSDLSKYDNLQIAQMMYDKDREMGIFGKGTKSKQKTEEKPKTEESTKTLEEQTEKPAAEKPEENTQPKESEQPKSTSKFNPEGLEYVNSEDITPELLLEAYKKFLEEKTLKPDGENPSSVFNTIFNTLGRTEEQKLNLIDKVFKNFNIENTKLAQQSLEKGAKELSKNVKNKKSKLPEHERRLIKALTKSKEYKELLKKLRNTPDEHKMYDYNTIDKILEKLHNDKKISDEDFKNRETLKNRFNLLMLENKIKSTKKNKNGGTIDFARNILYARKGSIMKYLYGGGILFKGDWWDDIFIPGIKGITEDFIKLLDNKDGEYDYLFSPGDSNSFYNNSARYYKLRNIYDNDYLQSGGYYSPEDDSAREYLMWIYKHFPSLINISTKSALKQGKYYKGDNVITDEFLPEGTTYEGDNMFSGRSRNLHLGNSFDLTDPNKKAQWLKWVSYLLDLYKDKYTFYIDDDDDSLSIYKNEDTPDSELGLTSVSDYITNNNIDLTSVTNPYDPGKISTTEASSENEDNTELSEVEPLPPGWFANLPKDNLTTARILNTLFGNAMTFAIRDKYKPLFAKDLTYLDFKRVFRDTSAADATNRLYGQFLSREQGASADQRLNAAAAHDLISKYNTAMLAADELNKKVFDTTSREAQEAAKNNSLNLTNTYNANLKKYTDEQRLLQEYTAGAMKQAGENVSGLFSALILEKGTERLYGRLHYLTSTMQLLQDNTNKLIQDTKRHYYQIYKSNGGDPSETIDTFYATNKFKQINGGLFFDDFNKRIERILDVHRENVENLYRTLYNSDLFANPKGHDINPGLYGGLNRPLGVSVKQKSAKQGGKIVMAKQGGASVNWVRVENARMLNKQVNTSMRETYKSLRLANAELQKTIRAMEPLIRKLNRRDSVKLQ